MLYQNIV